MRDFIDTIKSSRVVLIEGGIIERNRDIELDSFIAHSGMIYEQIKSVAQSGVDFIMASTLPAFSEAMCIALALSKFNIPYIISFVVTPEGTLLDGTPVHEAIDKIDSHEWRRLITSSLNSRIRGIRRIKISRKSKYYEYRK